MDPIGLIVSEIVQQASELFDDPAPATGEDGKGCPKCPNHTGTFLVIAVLGIAGVMLYSRKKGRAS
jgi:hypothetical protein